MAFLELNGFPIPVAQGGGVTPVEFGVRKRAFDTTYFTDRRGIKRTYRFSTIPLTAGEADAVVRTVRGEGQYFPFDGDSISSKGLQPSVELDTEFRSNTAADGDAVKDENGFDEAEFSSAIYIHTATTNIIGADGRDAEAAPTGYATKAGGVISGDTSNFLQGARSLKVVTLANLDGARTNDTPALASTIYTGSVYVKGTTGEVVFIDLRDQTGSVFALGGVVTLTSNQWRRIKITGTSLVGTTDISIAVSTFSGAQTFFCDEFQIEQRDFVTSWVDGSRIDADLCYLTPNEFLVTSDITINVWIKTSKNGFFRGAVAILAQDPGDASATDSAIFVRTAPSDQAFFQVFDSSGSSASVTSTSAPFADDDWHMITGVVRTNPDLGESNLEIFVDGVLEASLSTAVLPIIADLINMQFGRLFSGSFLEGAMDDLAIYPFAAGVNQVLGWFNSGFALGLSPKLRATGDFDRRVPFDVIGHVESRTYMSFHKSAVGFQNNAQVVQFILEEV